MEIRRVWCIGFTDAEKKKCAQPPPPPPTPPNTNNPALTTQSPPRCTDMALSPGRAAGPWSSRTGRCLLISGRFSSRPWCRPPPVNTRRAVVVVGWIRGGAGLDLMWPDIKYQVYSLIIKIFPELRMRGGRLRPFETMGWDGGLRPR